MSWVLLIIIAVLAFGVAIQQSTLSRWRNKAKMYMEWSEADRKRELELERELHALEADLTLKAQRIADMRDLLRDTMPVTVPKVACGLRQVAEDISRDIDDSPEAFTMSASKLRMGEYQDRINGYAAELEAACQPLTM